MSTIELGELTHGDPAEPAGPVRFDRRMLRRTRAAVVAVLCLFGLAASDLPEPRGLRPLWSVPYPGGQGTALTADAVYMHRNVIGGTTLTAYDQATGAVRWECRFAGPTGFLWASPPAGLLLVPVEGRMAALPPGEPEPYPAEFHRRTIALSMATGAEVWSTDGEPHTVAADTALMTEHDAAGDLTRMRLIRLADHGTVWTRDTGAIQNHAVATRDTRPVRIVTATEQGDTRTYEYATGALLASARLPMVGNRPDEGYYNDLSTMGTDYLVLNRARANLFDMIVYRMDSLTRLWSSEDTNGYAFECGPSLCLNDGGGLVAHDPATGRPRWEFAGAAHAWPVAGGRLMIEDGDEQGSPVLADATTGIPAGPPARGSVVWSSEPTERVLLLRTTTSPPERTSVTSWDLTTDRRRLLGSIEDMAGYNCAAVAKYLTCTRDDRFEVTAVA